jgi:hypothetical protein
MNTADDHACVRRAPPGQITDSYVAAPIYPQRSSPRPDVAHQLGVLAMRFRRTRDVTTRRAIAAEYAQEVERLIETGAFFAYWCPDAAP